MDDFCYFLLSLQAYDLVQGALVCLDIIFLNPFHMILPKLYLRVERFGDSMNNFKMHL